MDGPGVHRRKSLDLARALKSRVVGAAALSLLVSGTAAAAPARWHFVFGKTLEISILFEREEKGDTTRLLARVPEGRFVFASSQDAAGRDSTESIRRLPDGETFTRRLVLSSFEKIPSCSSVHAPDACLIFSGRDDSFAAGFSAFGDEGAAMARARAAGLVSPAFRDALFGLAPLLPAVAEFGSFTSDFLGLVWPDHFGRKQSLRKGERTRGCAFDATFGFPCSPEERAREDRRFANGAGGAG